MTDRYTLHAGDCRDVMRDYPADHFDSIVSDPPYGLSFMGKGWDRGVPGEEFWREALRVAKPGAHLLAFGGSRTFHRLTVAIEDAGWEIRDVVCWLYGSGFPKSLDVSKAIDRVNGETDRLLRFTAWMRTTGVTARQIDAVTQTNMGSHYLTAGTQPAIPTAALWQRLRPLCGDVPAWVDALVERIAAEREVVGAHASPARSIYSQGLHQLPAQVNLTAPATADAQQWAGWGTALKPAWEPVIVARKPLVGTVAANVTRYGTGAINIDGCRVGDDQTVTRRQTTQTGPSGWKTTGFATVTHKLNPPGRWPANVMHDGSDEVVAGFPADEGRFFYCAKASRTDREEGCDHLPARTGAEAVERDDDTAGLQSPRAGAGRTADTVRNFHPTVKPTDLMRYLARLVTPPDGLLLDPFMGSGSTGKGALLEGFRFVGIDLDPAHVAIAEARCQFAVDTVDAEAAAAEAPGAQLALF